VDLGKQERPLPVRLSLAFQLSLASYRKSTPSFDDHRHPNLIMINLKSSRFAVKTLNSLS